MNPSAASIAAELLTIPPADDDYAARFVERLLVAARQAGASDLHLLPTPEGLQISWRRDGVLQPLGAFPPGEVSSVTTRLKVLAELLTYRSDIPQEGRIRAEPGVEMRVSTLPTLHGEKVVVRLFQSGSQYQRLADLGLPDDIRTGLLRLLHATSGAILVAGPAGAGKTTTLYACLRELTAVSNSGRGIVTLEDPIEVPLAGVTQSQASAASGYDMAAGLRAIVRQDPEVIMVGEIRDRATAQTALQASLTGQLVLSSFHAGSAAGAISRLLDMEIEPYVLRSGVLAILCQRLVRKLCGCQSGCDACGGTRYRGRMLLAELLPLSSPAWSEAILARHDADRLQRLARETGMIDLATRGKAAVDAGLTDEPELQRTLGMDYELPPPTA